MTAVGKVSVAASLAMLAWMGRSIVTGEIPFTGDLLHFHYAVRDFYARALAAGHGFDWIPGLFGGYYLVGEGQLGGYHPLHLLLYRMLPLDRALAVELVAAYPFMFAGTWLWMRRWCGESAAAFGAMTATFCGFMLVHGVHPNMVGVVAHVPWLLWTLDNAAASRSAAGFDRRGTAVIGLLIGSQFLLGYPQSVWFSALASTAYAAHLMAEGRPVRWFIARTWIAGVAFGVAVGAVQILATLDATFRSVRPSFDTSFATQYSLRPLHLLQTFQPYLFSGRILRWNEVVEASDEYGVYGGGVAFLLAVWWLARLWAARRFDRFSVHVAAFGAIALWLATGSYGKLSYVQAWLPLVTRFRAPVRYTVLAQLAVAVLAARALAAVIGRDTEADRRADGQALKVTWLVVAVAAATAMWLSMRGELPQGDQARLATWMGPLVLAAAAVLLSLAVRGARFAVVGLVLLAAGDQALHGLGGVIGWHDFVTRQQAVGFLDTNSFLPEAGESRLLRGNFPNLYLLRGHRLLDGYVALPPSRQLDYHQPNALRVARVGSRAPRTSSPARRRRRVPRTQSWLVSAAGRAAARAPRGRRAGQHVARHRHCARGCGPDRAGHA